MKITFITKYMGFTFLGLALLTLSGCTKNPEGNHPPVVKIVDNTVVNKGDMVKLTAHVSDIDKDELSHLWTMIGHPEGSTVALEDDEKTSISFKADKYGIFKLNFTTTDDIVNSKKTVTVTVASIAGEWKADLAKTKEKNSLNESQTAEVIESLSANYKYTFLENGNVEGSTNGSWKYNNNGNYSIDNSIKIKMETANDISIIHSLKDGNEVKFYYKRVFKK